MQIPWYSRVENALKEAGDKIDANDKAAVESDLNALKDMLAKCTNPDEVTDAQVADIKAAKEKTDGKCSEAVCKDV